MSVDTGPVRGSVVGEVSGTGEEMRVWTPTAFVNIQGQSETGKQRKAVCVCEGTSSCLSRDVTVCGSVHGKCLHWGDMKWNSAGMYVEGEQTPRDRLVYWMASGSCLARGHLHPRTCVGSQCVIWG